jgi:hypothetical protein
MSETRETHSPLPWSFTPNVFDGDDALKAVSLRDETGKSVFTVDHGDFNGLSDANAEFIVQAVNSYESLLTSHAELLAALKKIAYDADTFDIPNHVLAEINAAIARAEATGR